MMKHPLHLFLGKRLAFSTALVATVFAAVSQGRAQQNFECPQNGFVDIPVRLFSDDRINFDSFPASMADGDRGARGFYINPSIGNFVVPDPRNQDDRIYGGENFRFYNGADANGNPAPGTGSALGTVHTFHIVAGPRGHSASTRTSFTITIVPPTAPPSVTTHPVSTTVNAGANASFTAAANGRPAPSVQWQVSGDGGTNFTDVPGATSTNYSFVTSAGDHGKRYRAVFANSTGNATTNPAILTVNSPPAITGQPGDQTVASNDTVAFSAAASGQPAPTVQWQVSTDGGANFADIPGATTAAIYSIVAAASDNGKRYRAVFANSTGNATTNPAILTVNSPPAITTQPGDQAVASGDTVAFSAAASGQPAPTVQWQVSTDGGVNFVDIPGATAGTYNGTASRSENQNRYRAVFSNGIGVTASDAATLTVNFANLSLNQVDAPIDLFTATGQAPGSGTFSGPGTANGVFGPGASGPGVQNVTFTPTDGEPEVFTITVTETPGLVVTTTADVEDATDGETSLREAIAFANSDPDASVITFEAALAGQTLELGTVGDNTFGPSALLIDTDIAIDGGSLGVTIARDKVAQPERLRLFHVAETGALELWNLTLSCGRAKGGDSYLGGGGAGLGGAIVNGGVLGLRNVTMSKNEAVGGGYIVAVKYGGGGLGGDSVEQSGGAPNGGPRDSNGGFGGGGGVEGFDPPGDGGFGGGGGASEGVIVGGDGGFGGGGGSGRSGGESGFGAQNGAQGNLDHAGAGLGGAVFNYGGAISIMNSTLSANIARGGTGESGSSADGFGGAIFNLNGTVSITNSTLADNVAAQGGGSVFSLGDNGVATQAGPVLRQTSLAEPALVTVTNSILSGSNDGTATPALVSDFVQQTHDSGNGGGAGFVASDGGFNILQTRAATKDDFGGTARTVDPLLGPLADNGGPTFTHAPLPGSPVIDAGDPAFDPNAFTPALTTDQRGNPRVAKGLLAGTTSAIDIGASELNLPTVEFTATFDGPATAGGTTALTYTITNTGTVPATGLAFTHDLDAILSGLAATGTPMTDPLGQGSSLTGTSTLTFTGGSLGAGETSSFDVTLQVPANSAAGNYASLTSQLLADGYPAAPAANDTLEVEPPPLFTKSFSPDTIVDGEVTTLVFTIDNSESTLGATSLAFTDNLPAGLVVASPANVVNQFGGTLTAAPGSGVISLTGGSIAAGTSGTLRIDVTTTTLGALVNTTSDLISSNGNSGPATDTLTVIAAADLSIEITATPTPVRAGSTLTYTFTVTNDGPSTAENVVVNTRLLAGMTLIGTSGAAEDPVAIPTASLGDILAGESKQFTVTVRIGADQFEPFDFAATVTSDTLDRSGSAISESATLRTLAQIFRPDLRIGEKASAATHDGDDDYGAGQKLRTKTKRNSLAFYCSVQNDGNVPDCLVTEGRGLSSREFRLRIQENGGGNVTGAFLRDGAVRELAPGETTVYKIVTKRKDRIGNAKLNANLSTTSLSESISGDRGNVRIKFGEKRSKPGSLKPANLAKRRR